VDWAFSGRLTLGKVELLFLRGGQGWRLYFGTNMTM